MDQNKPSLVRVIIRAIWVVIQVLVVSAAVLYLIGSLFRIFQFVADTGIVVSVTPRDQYSICRLVLRPDHKPELESYWSMEQCGHLHAGDHYRRLASGGLELVGTTS